MPGRKPVTKRAKTKIEALKHKDKRANIPTEELRDFVADEELAPKTMLYPRDSSLDPQLVWKGKDDQDREDLAVAVVPIYIQEKIHPQAIIDALPRIEHADDNQPNLFADFNGGPADFAQKIDFYHHEQNWANRMILGDSLLVMTSLAEKEGLKGKVQSIYLDPPYGIKFGSNWQVSTRKRDVKDGKAEDATRQPEQVRAFRDTWKLGIHSYLAYLRDRLVVARDLLTETGSVLVQIGDENVHLVRNVMDEVFGSENFLGQIFVAKTSGFGETLSIASVGDDVVWYAKNADSCKYRQLYADKGEGSAQAKDYRYALLENGETRNLSNDEVASSIPTRSDERRFSLTATTAQGATASGRFPIAFQGKTFHIGNDQHWKTSEAGMARLIDAQRIHARQNSLRYIRFLDDFPVVPITNNWVDLRWGFDAGEKRYVVETNPGIVARCLLMTTDPGDLVLDPTCGSGTTAYVAEQWGRRWITCDTSRVALALARTRMMAAKYPYYLLADSPEGIKKEAELSGKMPPEYKTEDDIRKGFVYKRVPHVTLKSIANNPDIKEGMTRQQIDAAIARNAVLADQEYRQNNANWRERLWRLLQQIPSSSVASAAFDTAFCRAGGSGGHSLDIGHYAALQLDNYRWLPTTCGPRSRSESFYRVATRRLISIGSTGEDLGDTLLPYVVAGSLDQEIQLANFGIESLDDLGSATTSAITRALALLGERLSTEPGASEILGVRSRWRLVRGALQDMYRTLNQSIYSPVFPLQTKFATKLQHSLTFECAPLYYADPGSPVEDAFVATLPLFDADRPYAKLFEAPGVNRLVPGDSVEEALLPGLSVFTNDIRDQIVDRLAPFLLAALIVKSDRRSHVELVR